MNITEEHIDKLTRNLMKDTAEQPSPSLNARTMALIMGEKMQAFRKCHIKQLPSVGTVLIIFVVYMLILVGGATLLMKQTTGQGEFLQSLKQFFPILLTISSSISVFFFFSQLDNWLRMKERIRENLQK